MDYKYEFKEHRFRSGSVEYKYMCPLLRGEHRPRVFIDAHERRIYATGISGYVRTFENLDAAMYYVADVPLRVGGFIRD